jgi:hypothetical protein
VRLFWDKEAGQMKFDSLPLPAEAVLETEGEVKRWMGAIFSRVRVSTKDLTPHPGDYQMEEALTNGLRWQKWRMRKKLDGLSKA